MCVVVKEKKNSKQKPTTGYVARDEGEIFNLGLVFVDVVKVQFLATVEDWLF